MNKILLFLSLILLVSCDPNDPPEEDPIIYPVTYTKADYEIAPPLYLLIEEGPTTTPVAPSTEFADFLAYFETVEYPDIHENFYFFHSFELLSDSTLNVVTFNADVDPGEDEFYTTELFYSRQMDQIVISDSTQQFEYKLDIDQENNRLINCQVVFTNTYFDTFANRIEYNGFDLSPCYIYASDDLALSYLTEVSTNISAGDTLAQLNISSFFDKE